MKDESRNGVECPAKQPFLLCKGYVVVFYDAAHADVVALLGVGGQGYKLVSLDDDEIV